MKLIFLDIDGVLATRQEWGVEKKHITFPSGKVCRYGLNQQCCDRLKKIIEIDPVNIKIILSSSWKYSNNLEDMNYLFNQYGLPNIHGYTLSKMSGERIHEIKLTLADYKEAGIDIEQWISLDDLPMSLDRHEITIKGNKGLTDKHVARAIKKLRSR